MANSEPYALTALVQAKFDQAFAFHVQGLLSQAQALYKELLEINPNHADALHLLGVIAFQGKNHRKAVDLIGNAIAINPHNAAFYSNRGLAFIELKRFNDAVADFDKAITIKPDYHEAHFNRGNALLALGQLSEAVASYEKAIAIKGDYHEAFYNRGLLFQRLNRPDAALSSFDAVISFKPDHHEAHYNRGMALDKMKEHAAAVESFDRAININPGHFEAYANRGIALTGMKALMAALESFDNSIAIKADVAEVYYNRGVVLQELGKLDAAMASYDKAIAINPCYQEAYINRGNAFLELKQFDNAFANYDKAIGLKPDDHEAHSSLGVALMELRRFEAALASFDKALALKPDDPDICWNKSLALLACGNFKSGFELYECRWKRDKFTSPVRNFTPPLWLGNQSLEGKTILIHSEQGLGDTIQFCRYIPMVANLGARVIFEVERPLIGLLEELDGLSCLVEKGSVLPEFDCHCPLMSLPLAFKTESNTIPCSRRYLKSRPDKLAYWENRLGKKSTPLIGVAWNGNATHLNDRNRSIPLSLMIQHLPVGFKYVSLQKEVRQTDKTTLESSADILHFGDELSDFTDTAALCGLMDMVISIDSSVAHLSGALGVPTWLLLPFSPDWRWMFDRSDSIWYPTLRLFRQQKPDDWVGALEKLKSAMLAVYGK
ncbi:MAG: tetratricopeptide repeat protein [Chlorobiaceae bacterium]|nr:tetratricopeptide repeat protein [Chlorobiaceae bacterium]